MEKGDGQYEFIRKGEGKNSEKVMEKSGDNTNLLETGGGREVYGVKDGGKK